jgi:hypothetical protein
LIRKPSGPSGEMRGDAAGTQSKPGKKPYRTPRLSVYGELSELALVKGGAKGDGPGKPATKA